jgi:hypothetical protein
MFIYLMDACNLVESLLQLVLHVFYLILGHVSLVIYSVTHGSEEPTGEAGGRRGTRTLAHYVHNTCAHRHLALGKVALRCFIWDSMTL